MCFWAVALRNAVFDPPIVLPSLPPCSASCRVEQLQPTCCIRFHRLDRLQLLTLPFLPLSGLNGSIK